MPTKEKTLNGGEKNVRFIWIFIPFALSFFMSVLLRTVNNVLAPTLTETFDMNASQLGIMTSAYFISFAVAQIPLGVCLDKWGPGKSLGCFMLFGVAGCIIFGVAPNVTFLFIGRAFVGFGVSGCLMASYKAIGDWKAGESVPMYNGFISFFGGVGGIFATKPVSAANDFIGWRALFFVFAGMTLLVAIMVFFTKNHPKYEKETGESASSLLKGTGKIAITPRFWRFAPTAVVTQATYVALNSLWIGPWLRDVGNYSESTVTNLLLLCSISITVGYVTSGSISSYLKKKFNIRVISTFLVTMWGFTIITALIAVIPAQGAPLWLMFLLICPFCLTAYPIFTSMFSPEMAGRVQTLFNMIMFIMSTVFQSGVGIIIDQFPVVEAGSFNPEGYRISLLVLAAVNAAALLWYAFYRRKQKEVTY